MFRRRARCGGRGAAEFRRIALEKLRPWDFGTGLALRDWLKSKLGKEKQEEKK
jgi:hypothetical protein